MVRPGGHRQTKRPATVMPHLHHRATSRLYLPSFFSVFGCAVSIQTVAGLGKRVLGATLCQKWIAPLYFCHSTTFLFKVCDGRRLLNFGLYELLGLLLRDELAHGFIGQLLRKA